MPDVIHWVGLDKIMKTPLSKFVVVLLSIVFLLATQTALAQEAAQKIANDSAVGSDVHDAQPANTNPTNAELLKELEQMRARITQLENQLKAQSDNADSS